ncbi:HAMP domain-containing histidine kinase [Paraconexibacter antarcticus]|uniref:Sensor-like histidine kinase SenX3 n=1 Tax=Paraconexibacter antarcticus TaxID=2949664 RepID=A0ABY5DZ65_9ACTN|nr:HAMP domain-containing sensor histidine kinase [Paraconexibacter antarcticus]UTI66835.1 HAMP domain-containing histidine kinase [Paraconexibacter antarcticus]
MSRRLAGVAFALALTTAITALALVGYGTHAAVVTFELLAPLGVITVLAAEWWATNRQRAGGLRRQFVVVAAVAGLQFAAAVLLFAQLMFVSAHDAFFTVLVVLYASAVAGWTARLLGRAALDDLDAVRSTLTAVGDGRRDVLTGVTGGDEVAALAADVDGMVARLAGEEEARATLMAAVSHDLRTPITSLRLLADAIDDDLVDAAMRREYAARMSTHVRALSALIDDLFELTRLRSSDLQWTMEAVRLDELVADTVEAMRPAAGTIAVRIGGATPVAARANPEKLQRVLFNLIQNAIRHTPPDGSITVRTSAGDGTVEVEVADNGSGIAPADRARVFEPFYRGDRSRTDAGAGLGLAICSAIVEAHGGRIWLADAAVGTAVRFEVPAG